MKRNAIISMLWGTQLEVLRQFLAMHNPLVVIVRAGMISQETQSAIADSGSTMVVLDDLVNKALTLPLIASESAALLARFDIHLHSSSSDGTSSQNFPDGVPNIIAETLSANLPLNLWLLECLSEAEKQFDLKLFVTNEDVTSSGKTMTAWAKAHSIPSLHLSHSIALVDPYTVHNEVLADKLAVFGRRGMEGYLDLGYPEDRMVLTGNPAWDCYTKLRQQKPDCRKKLNNKYNFNPHLPLVVFGTTYSANLSAYCNENIFEDTLMAFLVACKALWENGINFNAVIKDHPSNQAFGRKRCAEILTEMDVSTQSCTYCNLDGREFATAADVLVGVDSNYLVEGMLAHTPVVNLMNVTGLLMGPCFEAETGILEVEWNELASAIQILLTDSAVQKTVIDMGSRRSSYYNHEDGDGMAAVRVAQVMSTMANQLPPRSIRYAWQDNLDITSADVVAIDDTIGQADFAAMYTNQPSFILDIGCATGRNAALIKQRFPGSRAWGMEMNHSAALIAKTKLDHVLVGRFEDFDLSREGILPGTVDAVLLADVLEHMYNPWDVMMKLYPYMADSGQVLLSIHNVRNMMLIDSLSKGNWTYSNAGLLNINHIRFFTRKEILKFCDETGYRVIEERQTIDPQLTHLWQQYRELEGPYNMDIERLTLKAVSREELLELCTLRYHFLIEKRPSRDLH